jgi:uncharacterized protein (DUF433 family)
MHFMSELISIDPSIRGGTPCIATTRLDVYCVAARFNAGESAASILDGYPDLTSEHVAAAVAYAAAHPFEEHPEGHPWRKPGRKSAA